MTLVLLAISLLLVILGAEALVRGSSSLALRLGVSPLFVGLTLVGFGTSSPELAASLTATLRGMNEVSVGNVVGSNIFNIGLVLGSTALVFPIRVQLAAIRKDLGMAVAAAAVIWVSLLFGSTLPRVVGAGLVAVLLVYVGTALRAGRRAGAQERELARTELDETLAETPLRLRFLDRIPGQLLLIVGGLALLIVGSRLFVTSAVDVARSHGVSDLVIGMTLVAAGTSLPEWVTSMVAAFRRSPDLAVGNVIGSNIFNVFGILGVCAVTRPQAIPGEVLYRDAPVMLLATLLLLPLVRTGNVISRREGALLVAGYLAYLTALLATG